MVSHSHIQQSYGNEPPVSAGRSERAIQCANADSHLFADALFESTRKYCGRIRPWKLMLFSTTRI